MFLEVRGKCVLTVQDRTHDVGSAVAQNLNGGTEDPTHAEYAGVVAKIKNLYPECSTCSQEAQQIPGKCFLYQVAFAEGPTWTNTEGGGTHDFYYKTPLWPSAVDGRDYTTGMTQATFASASAPTKQEINAVVVSVNAAFTAAANLIKTQLATSEKSL